MILCCANFEPLTHSKARGIRLERYLRDAQEFIRSTVPVASPAPQELQGQDSDSVRSPECEP